MPRLVSSTPKYRSHKPSGQAIVTLSGRMHYLGPFGSPASRAEYDRLISAWLARGRAPLKIHDLTIAEVALAYLRHAETHYRKHGRQTGTIYNVKAALGWLVDLYGDTLAVEFDKAKFKAIRDAMIAADNETQRAKAAGSVPTANDGAQPPRHRKASRVYINDVSDVIRRMFHWLAEESMVPASVYLELKIVSSLRKGRTKARETPGKHAVADETVDATLPFLPPVVADMVRLQRVTGMRPGELCAMRPGDVDRSGETWVYRPAEHKTEHHGQERPIQIGPRGQDILRPYLLRPADAYCFSPAESERDRRDEAHANRKTPLHHGNAPGTCRTEDPKRPARDRYGKDSYARAVTRACAKAQAAVRKQNLTAATPAAIPERWTPNQLRHTFLTKARRECGLEAAQVLAGHAKADTTQIYAARDYSLAEAAIQRIG